MYPLPLHKARDLRCVPEQCTWKESTVVFFSSLSKLMVSWISGGSGFVFYALWQPIIHMPPQSLAV